MSKMKSKDVQRQQEINQAPNDEFTGVSHSTKQEKKTKRPDDKRAKKVGVRVDQDFKQASEIAEEEQLYG